MYINKSRDTAPTAAGLAAKLTANTITTADGTVLHYKD